MTRTRLTGQTRGSTLREYFERLDGEHPETVEELLAPGFRFATLWGEEETARLFSGGAEELRGYFASRNASGQRHHILDGTASEVIEIAAGYTTRNGARLASFVITAVLDEAGLITRMMAARTTAVSLLD
jgi:hypothetical protein